MDRDRTLRRDDDALLKGETTENRAPISERLSHYRITGRLGAGGMGVVYRARDEQLDREVAIKVLPSGSLDDPDARARLVREARAAAALNHPNICTVFEVGEADGQAFIAMELIDGQPLSVRVQEGPMPATEVIRYGLQLADALAHAHDRGIVHRDLKNSNVMVSKDGRLKVLDFGLAKRQSIEDATGQSAITRTGMVVGTLAYMAPEQLRGQIADTRSDVWALGVMFYEMVSGRRPFQGQTTFELSAAILNSEPPPLDITVPVALRAVIERCLEREPEHRYSRGREVQAALEAITAGETPHTLRRQRRSSPLRIEFQRRTAVWLAAAALVAIVAGLTAWQLRQPVTPSRSLAVLPLANVRNDPAIDYLCDGVTESLIDHVARLRSIGVVPAGAAFNFKGKQNVSPVEAARQLGADTVLSGTLARETGQLTVAVRLLDVATGGELWSKRYQRAAANVIGLEDEIASAIIDEGLRVRLTSEERRQLVRNPTSDPEAYDLYLRARYLQRRGTGDDYFNVRELLQRALVRDPNFASAYALLGGTYAMMAVDGLERPTDAWPQSNRYMRKAFELDPNHAFALALAHAQALFFDWDWAEAERQRRAIMKLSPGDLDPTVIRALALERWALGKPGEALQLIRRIRELDRLSPDYTRLEADYLADSGQVEAAVVLYEKAIRADPNDPNNYFGLAEALARQGRFDEAIEARRLAHSAAGDTSLDALLATARGEGGYRGLDRRWAELQLEALTARAPVEYVSPLDLARVYAQLGDTERAFQHLEAAFVDRSPGLVFLNADRAWDRIRTDPRFAAAIRRVGLPEAS